MSNRKDPADTFAETVLTAGVYAAWAVTAAAGTLVYRLLRKSPEKRLKDKDRNTGWGDTGQNTQCPNCQHVNNPESPLCSMCGARLE